MSPPARVTNESLWHEVGKLQSAMGDMDKRVSGLETDFKGEFRALRETQAAQTATLGNIEAALARRSGAEGAMAWGVATMIGVGGLALAGWHLVADHVAALAAAVRG